MDSKRALREFRQFVEREKNKRKGAFFFTFTADEGVIFMEEYKYLQKIFPHPEEMVCPFVPLQKQVLFYDEMTDGQILAYFSMISFLQAVSVPGYIENEEDLNLQRYLYYSGFYMLEVANMIHDTSAAIALHRITSIYDIFYSYVEVKDRSAYQKYMIALLDSFMIAHPEVKEAVLTFYRRKGISLYQNTWEEIRERNFDYASDYVRTFARQLKEKDRTGEKEYVKHAWYALKNVFEELSERLPGFLDLITAGYFQNIVLDILPVIGIQNADLKQLQVTSGTAVRRIKAYGGPDQWVRERWIPYEGTGDYLSVIYIYTESFIREKIGAPKRGRSASKVLKKKYARSNDPIKNIMTMKRQLESDDFVKAIERGVDRYLMAHPQAIQKKKKNQKNLLADMDYEKPENKITLDPDKLRQAKRDMNTVIGLLHEEEIDYHRDEILTGEEAESKTEATDKSINEQSLLNEVEKAFLKYIFTGNEKEAGLLLQRTSLSERILMKQINEKAIEEIDDVILENRCGKIVCIEDYLDEIRRWIGE